MFILRAFLVFLAGLAGHLAWYPTAVFPERWRALMRYAIGILLYIPSSEVIRSGLPGPREKFGEVERGLVAGLLAALILGGGVMCGHLLDHKK